MTTVTIDCGWCPSKDQTADIIHYSWRKVERPFGNGEEKRPYMVALCRRCCRATSLFWRCKNNLPAHLETYNLSYEPKVSEDIFSHDGDITDAFGDRHKQIPAANRSIAPEIPESVREACLDAAEARSPRAKCQGLRSVIEFALRESEIKSKPGATLGGILKEARKTYAISEPLIELCDNIKAFGNWGLHWPETEITKSDAENAEAITYAILDYLFVLPARVQKARASTDAAQNAHRGVE